ncbi:intracellular chloride channel [Aureococcus anophagefferens]|nr:intracellular chloride channel [Aureococcus anophagefferens]
MAFNAVDSFLQLGVIFAMAWILRSRRLAEASPAVGVDDYVVYPRRNGWRYRGVEMDTAIVDAEGLCPLYGSSEHMFGELHDWSELKQVEAKWLVYWAWPWNMPLDRIADYYGEKATYFMIAAVAGFAVQVDISVSVNLQNAESVPYFCLFMALWSSAFIAQWKRTQSRWAMRWGMVGFETALIHSPVDGELTTYFPPAVAARRARWSGAIIAVCGAASLGVVYCLFILNVLMKYPTWEHRLTPSTWLKNVPGIPQASIRPTVIGIANTAQIMVMECVRSVAVALNDAEGHRTDTAYEDALIAKTFIFTFVNAYTTFFYTAFVKQFQAQVEGMTMKIGRRGSECEPQVASGRSDCMLDLKTQLSSIFVSRVLISNVKEVLVPYYFWARRSVQGARTSTTSRPPSRATRPGARRGAGRRRPEAAGPLRAAPGPLRRRDPAPEEARTTPPRGGAAEPLADRALTPPEVEAALEEYDVMIGPFDDYAELVIIFGFGVLFVAAFPLAPLMASVNSYVKIRVNGWRISQRHRRPWPRGAEDIGTWGTIIELLSYLSVITNGLMIVFTGLFVENARVATKILYYLLYTHGVFLAKFLVALVVNDVPHDVAIMVERQKFTESKLITRLPDVTPNVQGVAALRRRPPTAREAPTPLVDREAPTAYDDDDDWDKAV